MALIYTQATLAPSKIELLTAWVGSQPWAVGVNASALEPVGAYRFDDPTGAVGIETHLARTVDDRLLQVPLTYRSAPLVGGDAGLVGTMEHSVLGTRWVYDGCADPVYAAALTTAILTGGREAELEIDGSDDPRRTATRVTGSGTATEPTEPLDRVSWTTAHTTTRIRAGAAELAVLHVLPGPVLAADAATLSGTWPGNDDPMVLAYARTT